MSDPYQWANPQALVDLGYPQDVAERAVFSASWVLWAGSGRALHAEGTRVDVFTVPYGGRPQLRLSARPVRSIERIHLYRPWDDTFVATDSATPLVEHSDWVLVDGTVDLSHSSVSRWTTYIPSYRDGSTYTDQIVATVTYTVKSNLPPQTHLTVLKLAEEYCKAALGKTCNLPERVTSITRQGMTWTLLDPADFLDKGLTGIVGIDGWLTATNPRHARQAAKLFDPAKPRLVSAGWAAVPTSSVMNGDGSITFYGHGAAGDMTIADADPGDSYVDLDTGTVYSAGAS